MVEHAVGPRRSLLTRSDLFSALDVTQRHTLCIDRMKTDE